jgi:hypothetical protein
MQRAGRGVGMEIPPLSRRDTMPRPQPRQLESFFQEIKNNVDLVVVVVPDKDSYGKMLIMFYAKPSLQGMDW